MSENDQVLILFYNQFSSPSRKVLMALYEKGLEFEHRLIDLSKFEQLESWYLEINPRGEVPSLKHGDVVITDSNPIMEYIDKTFGRQNQFFPSDEVVQKKVRHFMSRIDTIPLPPLTFGAAIFLTEHVTDCLRYPFCREEIRSKYRNLFSVRFDKLQERALELQGTESGAILAEKSLKVAEMTAFFNDVAKYEKIIKLVEVLLDEVEEELGSDEHVGAWLCGPTVTAADLCLMSILLRLHQIGLDEKLWKGGKRPHIAVYQEMAFKRPSFEKATKWSEFKNEVYYVKAPAESGIDTATMGLGVMLSLGALYIYKKFKK